MDHFKKQKVKRTTRDALLTILQIVDVSITVLKSNSLLKFNFQVANYKELNQFLIIIQFHEEEKKNHLALQAFIKRGRCLVLKLNV